MLVDQPRRHPEMAQIVFGQMLAVLGPDRVGWADSLDPLASHANGSVKKCWATGAIQNSRAVDDRALGFDHGYPPDRTDSRGERCVTYFGGYCSRNLLVPREEFPR